MIQRGRFGRIFIPDFGDWKNHDEYQKAFGKLMGDLKTGKGKLETSRPMGTVASE